MFRCFCRVYCLSTRTDKITSLHQNYQYHGSFESSDSNTIGIKSNCMFSLTVLPVHCRSTIYTGVTSLTSPTPMLRDSGTEALWSSVRTAVPPQNVLAKSLDKQTIWNYLQYYCLLNLTLQWRWQFWRNNVILSVQVLVKAVGVKLLKVIRIEITVF